MPSRSRSPKTSRRSTPCRPTLASITIASHRAIAPTTDERLAESIAIPWIPAPPLSLTVAEALTQAAMHTHYHRGQNATRLRELGGEPPMTDYIYWLGKGRPEPNWNP